MSIPADDLLSEKININYLHGKYFVWNAESAFEMRRNCRVVGTLVGCLPKVPFQNTQLGLPMCLMPEEAHLLLVKGYATITNSSNLQKAICTEVIGKLNAIRENIFKEQNDLLKEERKLTILSKADTIVAGKKRRLLEKSLGTLSKKSRKKLQSQLEKGSLDISKLNADGEVSNPEITKERVIDDELKKICDVSKNHLWVQLHTECPFAEKTPRETNYPSNEDERVRFAVFKDLWEQGFFLTNASKFGGDFLVYPGDPAKFHAWYIVHCVNHTQEIEIIDILRKGRLGTQVRKNAILATVKPDSLVDYVTINWAGD